ncbi:6-phosphogluconolactonase [Gryllotalpicola reticulitermitis]|uniref:6-phosphogluconolactonase n=1 Tax=Gryllotalpicola reticulitermitis TaxID=1184153 RepID=A0ABV8QCT7_9MICO
MEVRILPDRAGLGAAAAADVADALRATIAQRGAARVVFAAAPSQSEMLAALVRQPGIDWAAVTAFHMDEYVDLDASAPQGFGNWLHTALFDLLPFGEVHYLGTHGDAQTADAYATALAAQPIDVVCLGIGVNGHLAFNDPPVADFDDPKLVKEVELDTECRQQQVDDGCFAALGDVPRRALTLTVPALMAGARLFCVVPGRAKAAAVRDALEGPLGTACPASVLRRHDACTLYLDRESASALEGQKALS